MQIQESMKGGYSTYVSRGSGAGGMLQKIFELSRVDLDILACHGGGGGHSGRSRKIQKSKHL